MADEKRNLTGPASIRYCVGKLARRSPSRLPQTEGMDMIDDLRRAVRKGGYRLQNVPTFGPVEGLNIGLFVYDSVTFGVVLDGDKVVDNPTPHKYVNAKVLSGRMLCFRVSGKKAKG